MCCVCYVCCMCECVLCMHVIISIFILYKYVCCMCMGVLCMYIYVCVIAMYVCMCVYVYMEPFVHMIQYYCYSIVLYGKRIKRQFREYHPNTVMILINLLILMVCSAHIICYHGYQLYACVHTHDS